MVLGMGFGLLMDRSGYGVWWSLAMSLFLYAGSMQYAAVGLMTGGASLLTVALTTLAVNARHLFYGLSTVEPYQNAGAKKPYLIFALTDETYALVCLLAFGSDAFWIPSMLSIAAVTLLLRAAPPATCCWYSWYSKKEISRQPSANFFFL